MRLYELTEAEHQFLQGEIVHTAELCDEVDYALNVTGRRGNQTQDTVQKFREAQETLARALQIERYRRFSPFAAAKAEFALGQLQFLSAMRPEAEASIRRAFEEFTANGQIESAARARLVLGTLRYRLGRRSEGLREFDAIVRQKNLASTAPTLYGTALRNWLTALGTEADPKSETVREHVDLAIGELQTPSRDDPLSPATELLADLYCLMAMRHAQDDDLGLARESLAVAAEYCRVLANAAKESHYPREVVDFRTYKKAEQKVLRAQDGKRDITDSLC